MAENTVTNWFGNIVSHPAVVVDANSVDDIVRVVKDKATYPTPVRAVGSNHSTSPCGVAEGGTLLRMKMNKVLSVTDDTLVVQAGATHLELAKMLESKGLQFYINTEIGSLSAGSAACAGTKDASMPGEYGQVGSYVTGVKMVLPTGEVLEVTEAKDPELMKKVRCSYGTFGIVYEVTYRIRKLLPMAVHHETFEIDDFVARIPELTARGWSMFYYMFPFENKITVEFRKYNPGATGIPNRIGWGIRNHFWGSAGPKFGHDVTQNVSDLHIRYGIIDGFNGLWRVQLETLVKGDYTIPSDQIIHYPPVSNDSRYTFSLFAFPLARYGATLKEFYGFVQDYYKKTGYRSNLLYVGYWILQDQQALLSYSHEGEVMTIDPVSTANDGWETFLGVYNEWCSERNGVPLLNQTWGLTPAIVQKSYGDRLTAMKDARRSFDPEGRLLNDYFRVLMS